MAPGLETDSPPVGLPARVSSLSGARRLWGHVVARLHHFHWIDAQAARSAQSYFGHTGLLLDLHGFRSVLNLRGENSGSPWYEAEKAACAARGLPLIDISVNSRRLPRRETLRALTEALEQAPKPLLIKCSGGADRTGLAAGLYLIARHGRAGLPAARRQLATWPYLHLPQKHQKWLRPFFDYLGEELGEAEGERPLDAWLAEGYDPDRFAAWLAARGLAGSWRAPARQADGQGGSPS